MWFIIIRVGLAVAIFLHFSVSSWQFQASTLPRSKLRSFVLKQLQSATTVYEAQQKQVASKLGEWIISNGCKRDDCKIAYVWDGLSQNVVTEASVSLKTGETLFSLPIGLVIDTNKVAKRVSTLLKGQTFSSGDAVIFAIFLLLEKKAGAASLYQQYIDALPSNIQGILGWSKDELLLLQKSTTRNVQRERDMIENDLKILNSLDSTIVGSLRTSDDKDLRSSLLWSISIVKSRSFILDGQRTMLPGMDFISSDPFAENEPTLTSTGLFGGKVFKVQSNKSYKRGDVVTMSFGLKSSAEYLEDHGSVPSLSKADCICEIEVEINELDRFSDDKINILQDNGLQARMKFDLAADPNAGLDPELLQFLRLKLIESKDAFILEPCFANSVFYTMSKPFSKTNEQRVMEYILKFCQIQLEKFQEAEEFDRTIFQSPQNIELIDKLRKQEKYALEATRDMVQFELQNMQGPTDLREYYQERRLRELDLLRPLDESEVIPVD